MSSLLDEYKRLSNEEGYCHHYKKGFAQACQITIERTNEIYEGYFQNSDIVKELTEVVELARKDCYD